MQTENPNFTVGGREIPQNFRYIISLKKVNYKILLQCHLHPDHLWKQTLSKMPKVMAEKTQGSLRCQFLGVIYEGETAEFYEEVPGERLDVAVYCPGDTR